MNTDWEEGMPPQMLEIDVFLLGNVRRGWRQGSIFVPIDCTHPQQNMSIDIKLITHWRARDSIVVIQQEPSYYTISSAASIRMMGPYESAAASIFGGAF